MKTPAVVLTTSVHIKCTEFRSLLPVREGEIILNTSVWIDCAMNHTGSASSFSFLKMHDFILTVLNVSLLHEISRKVDSQNGSYTQYPVTSFSLGHLGRENVILFHFNLLHFFEPWMVLSLEILV